MRWRVERAASSNGGEGRKFSTGAVCILLWAGSGKAVAVSMMDGEPPSAPATHSPDQPGQRQWIPSLLRTRSISGSAPPEPDCDPASSTANQNHQIITEQKHKGLGLRWVGGRHNFADVESPRISFWELLQVHCNGHPAWLYHVEVRLFEFFPSTHSFSHVTAECQGQARALLAR